MSVTYVVSRWGAPTQTFVRREAAAVLERGMTVTALSLKRPVPTTDPPVPVAYLTLGSVAWSVAGALVQHPRRFLAVVATVLRHSRMRNRAPQLAAALTGIAWARRGLVGPRAHAHFGWVATTAAWAACRWSGAELSVVLHAFELHTARLVDDFTPIPLRAAAAVGVVTERDRNLLRERWGIRADLVRMGVPRAWLNYPIQTPEPGLVVSVGSLLEKKGHDVLLEAIARCPADVHLKIVGAGPLHRRLQEQRSRLGLEDRVELVGLMSPEEVRHLLQRASVSVLACLEAADGDRDGIPVALMEAMALGTPVVTTDVGGIHELVAGAGLIVPERDPEKLAAAIEHAMQPSVRAVLVRRGRARIAEGWTIEAAADRVASSGLVRQ